MAPTPRSVTHCVIAEVLGTFILVFLGLGAVHSAVLMGGLSGLWQVGIVWGVAIMLAVYVVGAISGAHINPAITIGLATWKLFPAQRVLPYIAAQLLGAFLASVCLYMIFAGQLSAKEEAKGEVRGEPGSEVTAMCYNEYYPNPGPIADAPGKYDAAEHAKLKARVTHFGACLAEVLGTALLGLVVVAVTEGRNPIGPRNLAPVFIGLTVAALISVIAPLTQACFNPARDFGPRVFAFLAGWGSIALPGDGIGFLTVYIISPIVGGILGIGLYQAVLKPIVLPLLEPESTTK